MIISDCERKISRWIHFVIRLIEKCFSLFEDFPEFRKRFYWIRVVGFFSIDERFDTLAIHRGWKLNISHRSFYQSCAFESVKQEETRQYVHFRKKHVDLTFIIESIDRWNIFFRLFNVDLIEKCVSEFLYC